MELVLAWLEAECARLKPEKRIARLNAIVEIFEKRGERADILPVRGAPRARARQEAQASALEVLKAELPRLMAARG